MSTFSSFDSYYGVKTLFVLGTGLSAVGAGSILFTSLAHVPAYVKSTADEDSLLKQWQIVGGVGRSVIPPLALVASGAHFWNSYLTHTQPQHWRFLTAGALTLSVLPYTFFTLVPFNNELTARTEKRESDQNAEFKSQTARELLHGWGQRNAIRGFLLLASAIVGYDGMLHFTF